MSHNTLAINLQSFFLDPSFSPNLGAYLRNALIKECYRVKHWQKFSHISQRKKPIGRALIFFEMPFFLWRIDFTSKCAFQIHWKFLLGLVTL
jgi:hypothetical protein